MQFKSHKKPSCQSKEIKTQQTRLGVFGASLREHMESVTEQNPKFLTSMRLLHLISTYKKENGSYGIKDLMRLINLLMLFKSPLYYKRGNN